MPGRGRSTKAPHFREVVKYVTSRPQTNINEHFTTSWFHCDLCQISLDFIGKVETRAEDMLYLKVIMDQTYNASKHENVINYINL